MKVKISQIEWAYYTPQKKLRVHFGNGLVASVNNQSVANYLIKFLFEHKNEFEHKIFEVSLSQDEHLNAILDSVVLVD